MMPGFDIVYECPECGSLLRRKSLQSGNTFGAKHYSDGVTRAPMLPSQPNLTKCDKCDSIFWLMDLQSLPDHMQVAYDVFMSDRDVEDLWNHPEVARAFCLQQSGPYARFLELPDLVRALNENTHADRELKIRMMIWRAFNDRIRAGASRLFKSWGERRYWIDNCKSMIEQLDLNDDAQTIIAAELNRNLGRFERCMDLLAGLDEEKYGSLVDRFNTEVSKHNMLVFEIRTPAL